MSALPSQKAALGFTLIELIVTIAIAAILMVVAVPGFISFQRSSAVYAAGTSFASALNLARAEAIKRSLPTLVAPVAGTNWASGWYVFVDVNGNSVYDGTNDILLTQQQALPPDVQVATPGSTGFIDSAGAAYVRYDAFGNPNPQSPKTMTMPNSLDFTATVSNTTYTRRVKLNLVGRALTCDPTKNTANIVC